MAAVCPCGSGVAHDKNNQLTSRSPTPTAMPIPNIFLVCTRPCQRWIMPGLWFVVCCSRFAICGLWFVVFGFWFVVCGLWIGVCIVRLSANRGTAVKNERGPRWVQDKAVFWCKGCNTDFSFLVRKHHCRHCFYIPACSALL